MAHRGPDGSGVADVGFAVLGHTRLAVLDTSDQAEQPMVDVESGCTIAFNGEIYNYVELRAELAAKGHRFRSTGDTEVLLRSYVEWGEGCLDRLNGMFAFAVTDPGRRGVLLARDRFGEKPLHLVRTAGTTWFASEAKALFAAGAVAPCVDARQLFGFLATGDLGHPTRTAFDGIEQLPGGHAAWVDAGGLRTWRWWSVPEDPAGSGYAGRPVPPEEIADLVLDAVDIRLRSDVPVGTSLSGGIDSTLLLSLVRSVRPDGEIHAFTAGFPGQPSDELPAATDTAARLGVRIHPVPLEAPDLDAGLTALHLAHESPVESPSVLAQYRVMQAASEAGITVLLDGQGGDETWAGYPEYVRAALSDELLTGRFGRAYARSRGWRAVQGAPLRPAASRYVALVGGARARRLALRAATTAGPRWLAPAYRRRHRSFDPLDGVAFPAARIGHVAPASVARDQDRVMLPRLLRYADRNSMAWSREVRLPYLDHRLAALAASLPLADRIAPGWTKEPLRRLLADRGMGDVARRTGKVAFMPPNRAWMEHPETVERTAEAWSLLFRSGLVAAPTPVDAVLPRWRVLSAATWADQFGVRLG